MKTRRRNGRRQYLYVVSAVTPCGFKYKRYDNTAPTHGEFKVNFNKYGNR